MKSLENTLNKGIKIKWNSSLFMPRIVSRITLKITDVRVEKLQEISEEDAFAEGIDEESDDFNEAERYLAGGSPIQGWSPAIYTFIGLWNSIHKKEYRWEDNPWVWVISFCIDK